MSPREGERSKVVKRFDDQGEDRSGELNLGKQTFIGIAEAFAARGLVFKEVFEQTLRHVETLVDRQSSQAGGIEIKAREKTTTELLLSDQCPYSVHLLSFASEASEPFLYEEITGPVHRQLDTLLACLERTSFHEGDVSETDSNTNATGTDFGRDSYLAKRRNYPEVAVREALLNLIVHRCYDRSAFAKISIFPNRLEFLSVGGLPQNLEFADLQRGVAVPRHALLCGLMQQLGQGRGLGLGLHKIFSSYERFATKPEIIVTKNTFTLVLPKCDYSSYSFGNSVSIPNSEIVQAPMIVGEHTVLEQYAREVREHLGGRGQFSRKDVEQAIRVSSATAIKVLKDMVEKGLVCGIGNGKNRRYYFDPKAVWPSQPVD